MPDQFLSQFDHLPDFLWNAILVGISILIGLVVKFILALVLRNNPRADHPNFSVTRSILSRLGKPFNYFLPLLALNFLVPFMRLRPKIEPVLDKIVGILLLLSFANVLIAIVKVFEDYAYHSFDIKKVDNLKERKIRTQLQFIRRLAISLIIILTACLILLSFNNLRRLGAGLLTGVGVGGIIIGFAAQKSLGNLLAGFQIAFTQPIRIDDVLVVEGEWGRVEEITLTYVVLNIWDQRRMILPINYFIEKPFQNWTRTTADILGTAFLYLDYTIPLAPLREELTRLLEKDPLWDKRVKVLQVTNASEKTIEIRALMSASSSGNAFDLRCNIREGLIKFVQENYPGCLPLTRLASMGPVASHPSGIDSASTTASPDLNPRSGSSITSSHPDIINPSIHTSLGSGPVEKVAPAPANINIGTGSTAGNPANQSSSSDSSSSIPGVSRSSPERS